MNLLSLISSWLDIICQVTMKCATVPKPKLFRELNTALVDQHGYHYLHPPSRKHCMPIWRRTNFSMTARRGPPTYMSDSPFCYAKRQEPRARRYISHVPQLWTTIENWRIIKRTDRGWSKIQKPRGPIPETGQQTQESTASWSGHRAGAWWWRSTMHVDRQW